VLLRFCEFYSTYFLADLYCLCSARHSYLRCTKQLIIPEISPAQFVDDHPRMMIFAFGHGDSFMPVVTELGAFTFE
jgi:hypothetical protein